MPTRFGKIHLVFQWEQTLMRKIPIIVTAFLAWNSLNADVAADTRPYEIVWANRTHDDHEPILPMTDAAGWRVETENAVARIESATDRQLFGPGVVRLVYRGTGPNPRVLILPPKPVRMASPSARPVPTRRRRTASPRLTSPAAARAWRRAAVWRCATPTARSWRRTDRWTRRCA